MMTPGTYLKKRRIVSGLTIMDLAAMVHTNPRLGGIDKVAWIERIEKDIAALSPDVIGTLADAFRFSRTILLQLITIRSFGADAVDPQPRLCMSCGCTEQDACFDGHATCSWADADDAVDCCTACTPPPSLILDPEA